MNATAWATKSYDNGYSFFTAAIDFGVKDSRGRTVGVVCELHPRDGGFRVSVLSARNGKKYGAHSDPVGTVATVEEAKALAESKARENEQRVTKDAAKTGGVYLTAGERKALKATPKQAPAPATPARCNEICCR